MAQLNGNMKAVLLTGIALYDAAEATSKLEAAGITGISLRPRAPMQALRRALRNIVGNGGSWEVRPLHKGHGYLVAWNRIHGQGISETHDVERHWSVGLSLVGDLEFDGLAWDTRKWLTDCCQQERLGCGPTELTRAMEKLARDSGGVNVGGHLWVVSPACVTSIETLVRTVGFRLTDCIGEISIGNDWSTGETILKAALARFDEEAAELAAKAEGQKGARFWKGQEERCEAARERLKAVEATLGTSLLQCHETLTKLAREESLAEAVDLMEAF